MSRSLLHILQNSKPPPQSAEIETQLTTLASERSRVTKLMSLIERERFRNPSHGARKKTEPPTVAGGAAAGFAAACLPPASSLPELAIRPFPAPRLEAEVLSLSLEQTFSSRYIPLDVFCCHKSLSVVCDKKAQFQHKALSNACENDCSIPLQFEFCSSFIRRLWPAGDADCSS